MSKAVPPKAPDAPPAPPPHEKTGVSYAAVVKKPAIRSSHGPGTHAAASVEREIRDPADESGRDTDAEASRRRRDRDRGQHHQRGDREKRDLDRARRRGEKQARREGASGTEALAPEKAGEDPVSDGTSAESAEPQLRRRPELVTAVRS